MDREIWRIRQFLFGAPVLHPQLKQAKIGGLLAEVLLIKNNIYLSILKYNKSSSSDDIDLVLFFLISLRLLFMITSSLLLSLITFVLLNSANKLCVDFERAIGRSSGNARRPVLFLHKIKNLKKWYLIFRKIRN